MTEDEPRTEPATDETAADKDEVAAGPPKDTGAPKDPAETPEAPDKTDMSAVGDDGQVFGG